MANLIDNPTIHTLTELLGHVSTQFRVPIYQRDYAWGAEQVDDFASDSLVGARADSEHFFGTLVLSDDAPGPSYDGTDTVRYVIDGQQRLTTSLLFLAAVCHHLNELHSLADEDSVRFDAVAASTRLLQHTALDSGEPEARPKLWANRANQRFLTGLLNGSVRTRADVDELYRSVPSDDRTRCDALRDAYLRLRGHIAASVMREIAPGGGYDLDTSLEVVALDADDPTAAVSRAVSHLTDLGSRFRKNSLFVEIRVKHWEDAFAVFEGLNNRGLELSEKDLVKNALLAKAHRNVDVADLVAMEDRWERLTGRIAESKFARFLRHFLLLSYEDVPLKRVVRTLTGHFSAASAEEMLATLERAGDAYSRITRPSGEAHTALRDALQRLNLLEADRSFPIPLAAMLRSLDPNDIVKLIERVEVLYFRRSSVMQRDNKTIESEIRDVAASLYQEGSSGLATAFERLRQITPDDEEFRLAFKNREGMKDSVARYMLVRIENAFSTGLVKDQVEYGNVTLEHILPKDPSDWNLPPEDLERHPRLHSRLGNLTLLRGGANASLGKRAFAAKQDHYIKEGLRINEVVTSSEFWTEADIVARQAWLADRAVEVWSL